MTISDDTSSSTRTNGARKLLARLARAPKIAVFVTVLAITLGVLWTPGPIGAFLTLVLAATGGYLLYGTWSRHASLGALLARAVVVSALAALGIAKFLM